MFSRRTSFRSGSAESPGGVISVCISQRSKGERQGQVEGKPLRRRSPRTEAPAFSHAIHEVTSCAEPGGEGAKGWFPGHRRRGEARRVGRADVLDVMWK